MVYISTRSPFSSRETKYEERLEWALELSQTIWMEEVEHLTREQAVGAVVEELAAPPLTLLASKPHIQIRNPTLIVGAAPPSTTPSPAQYQLTVPCSGAVEALADAGAPQHTWVKDRDNAIVMHTFTSRAGEEPDVARLGESLRQFAFGWMEKLSDAARAANAVIAAEREKLYRAVDDVLGVRHAEHMAMVGAAQVANIPLGRVDESERLELRLQPKRLRLSHVKQSQVVPGNEAALADDIADELISLIEAFSNALRRTPSAANKLIGEDEETIRDVLMFLLNTNWGGLATAESFIGEGKSDILFRWENRDAFIAECKIWDGSEAFRKGVSQLLDQYTVWGTTRVAMILFIRNIANIDAVILKARDVIRRHERFSSETVGLDRPGYLMHAQNDFQQIVTLHLIPVVIPDTARVVVDAEE